MNDKDLLQALRRLKVEIGSLACLGCGYEHDCGAHGCAILRKVEEQIVGGPTVRSACPADFVAGTRSQPQMLIERMRQVLRLGKM